jgi:hypothetical protein
LPENSLLALQARVGLEEVATIDSSVRIGQSVKIIEGSFQALEVVVTHLLPAKERIRVLLEFSWEIRADGDFDSKSTTNLRLISHVA